MLVAGERGLDDIERDPVGAADQLDDRVDFRIGGHRGGVLVPAHRRQIDAAIAPPVARRDRDNDDAAAGAQADRFGLAFEQLDGRGADRAEPGDGDPQGWLHRLGSPHACPHGRNWISIRAAAIGPAAGLASVWIIFSGMPASASAFAMALRAIERVVIAAERVGAGRRRRGVGDDADGARRRLRSEAFLIAGRDLRDLARVGCVEHRHRGRGGCARRLAFREGRRGRWRDRGEFRYRRRRLRGGAGHRGGRQRRGRRRRQRGKARRRRRRARGVRLGERAHLRHPQAPSRAEGASFGSLAFLPCRLCTSPAAAVCVVPGRRFRPGGHG